MIAFSWSACCELFRREVSSRIALQNSAVCNIWEICILKKFNRFDEVVNTKYARSDRCSICESLIVRVADCRRPIVRLCRLGEELPRWMP